VAAVVMAPGRNSATGKLHDKGGLIGIGTIPGSGVEHPPVA